MALRASKERITKEVALQAVLENKDVGKLDGFRDQVLQQAINPLLEELGYSQEILPLLYETVRARNIDKLGNFFKKIFNPKESDRAGQQLLRSIERIEALQDSLPSLRRLNYDARFSNPQEITDKVLEEILKRRKYRREYLGAVTEMVQESSRENLRQIDSLQGEEIVKKQLVIIGGGPITALLCQQLSPFFEITVITQASMVGKPWTDHFFHINSSSIDSSSDTRIPTLDGNTTPYSPAQFLGAPNTAALLEGNSKTVLCDDNTTRQYISGQVLGATIAASIACHADDYLVNQTFLSSQARYSRDEKANIIPLRGEDGTIREIAAEYVILATGSGAEVVRFEDAASTAAFTKQEEIISEEIAQRTKETIDKAKRAEALSKEFVWKLPRLLTLSNMVKLFDAWQGILKYNPNYYPFKEIFNNSEGVKICIIGGGDTAFVISEFFDNQGPDDAYPNPQNFSTVIRPKVKLVHFNIPVRTFKEFFELVRARYRGVFSEKNKDNVETRREKIELIEPIERDGQWIGCNVFYRENGQLVPEFFDYVVPATGFVREDYTQALGNEYDIQIMSDIFNETAAKGDNIKNLFILGAAALFKLQDYPRRIQKIIEGLGIPENTISLWVNALLAEKWAWSFLTLLRNSVPTNKVKQLLEYGPLEQEREKFRIPAIPRGRTRLRERAKLENEKQRSELFRNIFVNRPRS